MDGQDVVVTIEGYDQEEVGAERDICPTLKLKEFDRTFVVNRTNCKRIVAKYGNDLSEWIGKQITLYPSETDFGGRTVPCIRVREK